MPTRLGSTITYAAQRSNTKSRLSSTVVYAALQKQVYLRAGTTTTYALVKDYSKFLLGKAPIDLVYELINGKSLVAFTRTNSSVSKPRAEDGRTAIDVSSVGGDLGVPYQGKMTLYYDRVSVGVFASIAKLQDALPVLNSHAEFVALVNARFNWRLSEDELVDTGNWGKPRSQRAIRASQNSYFFEPGTQIIIGDPTPVLDEGVGVNQLSGWERPR